jgi:4-hydroxybenzoate polyprenyltransferase
MSRLSQYASFIKIEHSLFSLPLILTGALLAKGSWPSWNLIFLMILAGGSARVVALGLNRIIDRHIDSKNPRTQDRHLSSGLIKLFEAWGLVVFFLMVYLFSAWLISDFCLKLSWIPLLGFCAYPTFKRFTKWTHVGLGIVWSFIPLAGFFAVKPSLEGIAPVLWIGVFSIFWLAGFDIIYATMDEEFDRKEGLYSLPAKWGSEKAVRVAAIFHGLAFIALLVLYGTWFSGPVTVILLALIGVLLIVEQKFSQHVTFAFFHVNVVIGFLVFLFVFSGIKGV